MPPRSFLALLIAVLTLTACAASQAPAAPTVAPAATAAPAARAAAEAPASANFDAGATSQALAQAPVERKIIQTVNLTIRFQDVRAAAEQIKAIAAARGGYVAQVNLSETEENQYRGAMTLRVDARQLDAAVAEIKGLGRETINEQSNANDVTEEYVDLSARLDNLKRTETELQALLTEVRQNTRKAEDVLAVYRELTEIRGQIEQIQGRLQYLDTLSALATINVSLVPPAALVANPGWSLGSTAGEALRLLVSGLQSLATVVIYVLIAGLPLLALVLLPLLAVVAGFRHLRRRPASPPT
ncbi:MAG: DUF4349 domain-containing protein [Ardenticatenaceae bacterium]|nr:DUF4349 domain-containing protein [Ardenticatenaceae bacterium]